MKLKTRTILVGSNLMCVIVSVTLVLAVQAWGSAKEKRYYGFDAERTLTRIQSGDLMNERTGARDHQLLFGQPVHPRLVVYRKFSQTGRYRLDVYRFGRSIVLAYSKDYELFGLQLIDEENGRDRATWQFLDVDTFLEYLDAPLRKL